MIALESNKQITMSSVELVSYINSERKEGESELRHDHFMDKVVKVVGEVRAPIFRGTYLDVQNKERPCYKLPKREACLMAMSYSYDLQAKVFDKMTELEAQQAPQIPKTYAAALLEAGRLAEIVEQQTLQIEHQAHLLDSSSKWATVKRMEAQYKLKFNWRELKTYSDRNGYETPKVSDANYPTGVNTYHEDVWMEVYQVEILPQNTI